MTPLASRLLQNLPYTTAPNHGWALLPRGSNGWDFSTREGASPPQLTLTFVPPAGEEPPERFLQCGWGWPKVCEPVEICAVVHAIASHLRSSDPLYGCAQQGSRGYYEDTPYLHEPGEFMDISSIILALGPPVAEHLYAAWRRRRGKTAHNTASLRDLIAQDAQNELAARRMEREITSLGEYVVETLQPIFELDGSRLPANQLSAVVEALKLTLNSAGTSPDFLIEQRLDPLLVAKAYQDGARALIKDLSATETEFYVACLTEIVRRMIAVADQMPGFSASFMRDVLRSQSLILDHGRKILQELQNLTEYNRRHDAYLLNNFNLTFRSAVLHRFTELYILGLDDDDTGFRLHIDVSYMTVRADTTRSRSHVPSKSVSDIPSEDLLRRSKRLLLRGHAGSGKTTFLQWIATSQLAEVSLISSDT